MTSGITTFTMTRDQIIQAALRKIAVISKGQTAETDDITNASEALNMMLYSFMADGMPLWAIKEYTFNMTATHNFNIGVGQTLNTPAPLKIIQATIYDNVIGTGIPLNIYTHYNYNLLTNVTTTGTPTTLMYEPLNQTGIIHLWPIPDTYSVANRKVTLVYQRPFEGFVNSTDTVDFPQFWLEPIVYGLAWRLAPEYGVPLNDQSSMMKTAEMLHGNALSFGTEEGSLFLMPNWVGR